MRYYNVFEINTQCEGLESKRKPEVTYDHNPVLEAEKIIKNFMDCPPISYKSGVGAYYVPSLDQITVPPMKDYKNGDEFYSTLFHEIVHSTGHTRRLNRAGITETARFGDESYSKEELVAELGSSMLCAVARIDNSTIDNSAAYIGSWLRKLKDDQRLIIFAAAQAQKAANYILGTKEKDTHE